MQAILKILEAFYQHEFIKLLFHAAPSFVLGVLTTVYLWLDTNRRGFISRSVEYLLHLTPKPRALGNRDKANPIIQRIIRTAAADRSWVYFMGIAHIDICDDGAPLHVLFDEALGSGIAEARFVFLDPASPNCARREFHESDRDVEPAHKIRHSIGYLTRVRKTYPLVKFITSPEVPFYACFNQSEIVLHPYLNSKVGRETTCFWGPANGDLYKATKKHFERLWGSSRWVLLDLGNVLIDFDHRNVGRRIREVVGTGRPDVDETFIHKFIFEDSSGPGTSLNSQLDRGALTLEELRAKINSEFRMSRRRRC